MRWRGAIAVEGVETSDGRLLEPESIQWGELPMPVVRASASDERDDWMPPVIGTLDSIERQERHPYGALVIGEGTIHPDALLPLSLDLSVAVTFNDRDLAGPGLDHPFAVVRCDLLSVRVGLPKVWDECVMELVSD